MASVTMAMPITCSSSQKGLTKPSYQSFFNPLPLKSSPKKAMFANPRSGKNSVVIIEASFKEKVLSGVTAGALTAAMVVPDVAEAASGGSASLKNFLLSIGAGGVVLVAIVGAVVGVSNFDPVKRT